MTVELKDGVLLAGVRSEIVLALFIAADIFSGFRERLIITSLLDGEHMRASLHYVGAAGDIRLPNAHLDEIMSALHVSLGRNYDVVLESDHIHIEFQPKGRIG